MNCPNCGKEMEPGAVYSPRSYLWWTSEQEKLKISNGQRMPCVCVPSETTPSPLFRPKPSPRFPSTPVRFAGAVAPYYFPLKTKNDHLL